MTDLLESQVSDFSDSKRLEELTSNYYHKGKFFARAKFIPDPQTGALRLAMVQGFTFPMFSPDADRQRDKSGGKIEEGEGDEIQREVSASAADVARASRRARITAFDKILCNPDLDTFATFTYSPDAVEDKASWDDCYSHLKTWLSNRVSRNGLKYVIVPERHKSGAIHFHGILNSSALKLSRARSPHTGRALTHNGNPLYNLDDWRAGFSSAEVIRGGGEDRAKVAKYIFKYMGKQSGQKIGGRYMLSGGDLASPVYLYDDSIDTFLGGQTPIYDRVVDLGDGKQYREFSFI